MKKILIRLLILTPFLMAFQCDEDIDSPLFFNTMKVNVTAQSNFSLNDTIWVRGKISSKIFDSALGDSIPYEGQGFNDNFAVMKLDASNQRSNSQDAVNKFKLVSPIGIIDFINSCKNAELVPISTLSPDELSYEYTIGLIALNAGDYVLSWTNHSILTNENKNRFILDDYILTGRPNELEFNKCGISSVLLNTNEANNIYFFSVE